MGLTGEVYDIRELAQIKEINEPGSEKLTNMMRKSPNAWQDHW